MKKFKVGPRSSSKVSGKWLLGLALGAIMISSVFGIIFSGYGTNPNSIEYNGIEFVPTGIGTLTAEIDGKQLTFVSSPLNVETLNVSDKVIDKLSQAKVITVTYDPNDFYKEDLAQIQYLLEQNLFDAFDIYAQRALTNNSNFTSFMQLDCSNATPSVPVILLETGETGAYELDNNCIRVRGFSGLDTLSRTERILYGMLGVIE